MGKVSELKGRYRLLIVILFVAYLILLVQVEAANFSWKDDFDYSSVQQLRDSSWTITGDPSDVSLDSNAVVLNSTEANPAVNYGVEAPAVIYYVDHFPTGIYDWTAKSRSMWMGNGHGAAVIGIITDKYNYTFSADGSLGYFVFWRNYEIQTTFGSFQEQENVWVTLRLEKQGNSMKMYYNGQLMETYNEEDTVTSQLTGVNLPSPSDGAQKYDYYQIASLTESEGFPYIPVVIASVATAVLVVVGLLVYLKKRKTYDKH
jgi:hypothetical protein